MLTKEETIRELKRLANSEITINLASVKVDNIKNLLEIEWTQEDAEILFSLKRLTDGN